MNNNEIIQETYKLPSLGKLNSIKDSVTLRPMTTDEELLRLDATGREANRVFCDIIDACVVEPKKFKSYYLPIQDQVFLIYKLRTVTYGSKYNVSLICPHCGSPITLDVDLDSLPINYIEEEEFRKSPRFSKVYNDIKRLFLKADLCIGFAVGNDVRYLNNACQAFRLPLIAYRFIDVQMLAGYIDEENKGMGLSRLNLGRSGSVVTSILV